MNEEAGLRSPFFGALRLEQSVFESMRDAVDGVAKGVIFIVSVALLAGILPAAVQFVRGVALPPAESIAAGREATEPFLDRMAASGAFGDAAETKLFLESLDASFAMAEGIAEAVETSTPAPHTFVMLFEAIGGWLSRPFLWLAVWLTWGVLTLIVARLVGSRATIQELLATTSLAAAPGVLGAFSWVPCGGPLILFVAILWALAVYVKGVAVATRLDAGLATVVVFLPMLVLFLVALGMALLFGLGLGLAAS